MKIVNRFFLMEINDVDYGLKLFIAVETTNLSSG